MKNIIGNGLMKIGAFLWQKNGWTGFESYDDLNIVGKFGYHTFCEGAKLKFGSLANMHTYLHNTDSN